MPLATRCSPSAGINDGVRMLVPQTAIRGLLSDQLGVDPDDFASAAVIFGVTIAFSGTSAERDSSAAPDRVLGDPRCTGVGASSLRCTTTSAGDRDGGAASHAAGHGCTCRAWRAITAPPVAGSNSTSRLNAAHSRSSMRRRIIKLPNGVIASPQPAIRCAPDDKSRLRDERATVFTITQAADWIRRSEPQASSRRTASSTSCRHLRGARISAIVILHRRSCLLLRQPWRGTAFTANMSIPLLVPRRATPSQPARRTQWRRGDEHHRPGDVQRNAATNTLSTASGREEHYLRRPDGDGYPTFG